MTGSEDSHQSATEDARLRQLAAEYGVDYLESVSDDILDPALIAKLPVEWARSHSLLPVRIDGEPCVLTSDPDSVEKQQDLSLLVGEDLRPVFVPGKLIASSIERSYYRKEDTPEGFIQDLDAESDGPRTSAPNTNDLLQVADKAPVAQLMNLILLEAVKKRASDIHVEPFESKLRVRYRIDGILYDQTSPPKHLEDSLVSRLKVMARMDIAEKRLPQDGMARVRVGERAIDVRVSTVPVAEGERVVLRLLDRESALLPLSVLGMSDTVLPGFDAMLRAHNGMIIVSGPTGSGKTTTLYAALGRMDSTRKNIMTIEDPIEYQLPDIGQIQVKPKIGLTFAIGLRHILRQDPDIVLVGETRDVETAEIALRASLTGHLVFTTLHTNDAPSAIPRLVDMGVAPYLLASCLRGVLAQRLVRRLCPSCRIEVDSANFDIEVLGPEGSELEGKRSFGPVGCDQCLEGYSGRVGLFELLIVDRVQQALIRNRECDSESIRAAGIRNGMISMTADSVAKAISGATSIAEIIGATG